MISLRSLYIRIGHFRQCFGKMTRVFSTLKCRQCLKRAAEMEIKCAKAKRSVLNEEELSCQASSPFLLPLFLSLK